MYISIAAASFCLFNPTNPFQAKQNGAKPKQRKNWRKSTIQLVPTEPPPPLASAPDNSEAAPQNRADIPLRLPRAMSSESNPLTDRNAATKPDESASTNKENTGVPARLPARPRKNAATEKENHHLG